MSQVPQVLLFTAQKRRPVQLSYLAERLPPTRRRLASAGFHALASSCKAESPTPADESRLWERGRVERRPEVLHNQVVREGGPADGSRS